MKILLLEDDIALSDILEDHLTHNGFEVFIAMNGEKALEYFLDEVFDLAIMDINTPRISGLEVLKTIRSDYKIKTPVIMITAYQDTKHLKDAFENEVDDYIKKPFDLEELDQRVNRICRHFALNKNDSIQIGDITFNPNECELIINDKKVSMAKKERDILRYFITHKNRVVSSEELLQNIWTYDDQPSDSTIRVYIKTLREFIGKDKITTIRGIGYKFESE
ncbi:MAG: response regulator transcription factor [Campylobacteraceae bacterium]|nr:response regulator transcription factor [Campylobacteraceae bacterium]